MPPERTKLHDAAIRDAYARLDELADMGRRGREYVVAEADRAVAVERYRALLREVRSERAR